jgi:succinate dehydrogenase / fumarate reductase, membrane anchor subunit
MSMRTPLKDVRRLGSAHEGVHHFWQQRLTAVANLILIPIAVAIIVSLVGADHATVKRTIGNPLVAVTFLLLIIAGVTHMRLGMQVIIEDYVRAEGAKVLLIMFNTFFAVAIGLAATFAILKLSFGA